MRLVFGIIYVIAAIVFALSFYLNVSSFVVSMLLAVYLIGKGVVSAILKGSPLSALDSVSGFYFMLLVVGAFPVNVVTIIFLVYLAQKGALSILRGFQ